MNTARIQNRAAAVALSPSFEIPADGLFHLARKGEFPGEVETADGKVLNVIQVIDDAAISAMVNRFTKHKADGGADLLVDRDHLSSDPEKETIAEGWIHNVVKRGEDMYAAIRLSEQGDKDIKGGNYRFISGVWDVSPIDGKTFTEGCRVRPFELCEAGLTNRPNITRLNALSNRKNTLPDNPANSPAEQADIQNRNKKTMKQIATKLGLSADASEDAILGEIAKLENRASTAEGKVKPLETEVGELKNRLTKLDDESADAELDAAGIPADHADRAVLKSTLIANREGGRAMLKLVKPVTQTQQTEVSRQTNRAGAKPPGAVKEQEISRKEELQAGAVRNRANQIRKGTPGLSFKQAWSQAESEILAQEAK